MIQPTWQNKSGSVKLYLGDCYDLLKVIKHADILITDPPYGISYNPESKKNVGARGGDRIAEDDLPFDPSPFLHFKDVLLWGANNYCNFIPPNKGSWYFWDKVTRNQLKVRISEAEYAWHKLGTKPRGYRHLWCGSYRHTEAGKKSEHPTQKPVSLMTWCLEITKAKGKIVADPFMGSGSLGVACALYRTPYIGIEIEEKYFEIALRRIKSALTERKFV